jgi:putative DNA primase/helicase
MTARRMTIDHLSSNHRHALEQESAISPEVIAARGYRTITARAELRRLGFSDAQSRVPALLLPVWGVHAEVALYQS